MSAMIHSLGLDHLNVEQRIALADELLESAARAAEEAPLTEAQRAELERRLADSIARPDAVTPWEEVKARLLAKVRR
jgi:putative addiction module component (TIGR02574 family)